MEMRLSEKRTFGRPLAAPDVVLRARGDAVGRAGRQGRPDGQIRPRVCECAAAREKGGPGERPPAAELPPLPPLRGRDEDDGDGDVRGGFPGRRPRERERGRAGESRAREAVPEESRARPAAFPSFPLSLGGLGCAGGRAIQLPGEARVRPRGRRRRRGGSIWPSSSSSPTFLFRNMDDFPRRKPVLVFRQATTIEGKDFSGR